MKREYCCVFPLYAEGGKEKRQWKISLPLEGDKLHDGPIWHPSFSYGTSYEGASAIACSITNEYERWLKEAEEGARFICPCKKTYCNLNYKIKVAGPSTAKKKQSWLKRFRFFGRRGR